MDDLRILIDQAQKGCEQSFVELISQHLSKVSQISARFAQNEQETKDLVQEISLEVWKSLKKFKGEAPFEHWISRIAINRCHRLLKTRYREKKKNEVLKGVYNITPPSTESVKGKEAREVLFFGMRQLKPDDALVLALKELEGYSIEEISQKTRWSASKIKVKLHRARKKLRTILEQTQEWPWIRKTTH